MSQQWGGSSSLLFGTNNFSNLKIKTLKKSTKKTYTRVIQVQSKIWHKQLTKNFSCGGDYSHYGTMSVLSFQGCMNQSGWKFIDEKGNERRPTPNGWQVFSPKNKLSGSSRFHGF